MALVKFSNGNQNSGIDPWAGKFFDSLFNDTFISDRLVSRVPAVNISETDEAYHIELAVPGLVKSDFKINVDQEVLTISAEQKSEKVDEKKKYSKREYSYTSFTRSFTLPESVDHNSIDASYTDGVLRVAIGKKEDAKFASRLIDVK